MWRLVLAVMVAATFLPLGLPTGLPTGHATAVTTSGAVVATTHAAASRTAQRCPVPAGSLVRRAPGTGKTVALTFDDGASGDAAAILTVLNRYHVRATFFDTGQHDARYPAVVRELAASGMVLGDHTWDHYYPTQVRGGWSRSYLRDQLARTRNQQQALTGHPTCFFRPPGGYTDNVLAVSRSLGMSAVMWSVDSRDWAAPGHFSPAYQRTILANATDLRYADRDHPIVLMHAGKASHEPESQVHAYRGNTIAALPAVIRWYRARGYRFVDMFGNAAPAR
ncbi:polysaccharide deacetylase family protein [Oryzihumus sp.]|uniref:polysaccharide deacetylase family protein n=1 Tax=Oryzihumus sp. TaxID=1968903 RepID=UPI002EDB2CA9